jgi:uncharacterized OB-fold protein
MADDLYAKPVPEPNRDSKPYWDALHEGRLVFQACAACGKLRHYPRPVCDACFSMEVTWRQASGRGRIHSWTVAHHPFHPGFKSELPYVLATVDLEEGVRMLAQLRGVAPDEIAVGLPVEVAFDRATEELTLPAFVRQTRPATDPPSAAARA